MRAIAQRLLRLIHIYHIFSRYYLVEWLESFSYAWLLKIATYLNPVAWKYLTTTALKQYSRGERLRRAFEQLGPLFIKFGQLLSTRRDWIPLEVANELEKLQDRVPPFPVSQARAAIESALKMSISTAFSDFTAQPLASASIAQVHAACLHTGEKVIVKILRPNIHQLIARDIDLLYFLAWLAERSKTFKRLRPLEVVAEFERALKSELDFVQEAANASQLKRNLQRDGVYIPKIYWAYTFQTVLVMERITGISVGNRTALKALQINFHVLAKQAIALFFKQVLRDRFFHADLHPGNIFVLTNNPDQPDYCLVDFGIVGTLNAFDQRYLAENLMAFLKRDYQRVAELHVASGWVPKATPVEAFASAIRKVCEPIFERPLKEISIAQLLLHLFQTAKRFQMRLQPQLLLLQKTLFNIESLSRQLDPEIDLWETARPFLEHWLRRQMGPRVFLKKLKTALPQWGEILPELPALLFQQLQRSPAVKTASVQSASRCNPLSKNIICRNLIKRLAGCLLLIGVSLQLYAPYLLQQYLQSYLGLGSLSLIGLVLLLAR
jgi:ubiquinone biosynthesis protein